MSDQVEWISDSTLEEPTWFGPRERPLFGWLTSPADRLVRGAVVLCSSIGVEARSAHRTLRELSLRLADEGFLALRFDYDGTGDSAGDLNDPSDRNRWVESVDAAIRFVSDTGCPTVSVVGLRVGATIAAVAVSRAESPPAAFVLWDPCPSGRTFLREQSMLYRAMHHDAGGQDADGSVTTPDYVFAPEAAAALSGLIIADAFPLSRPDTAVTVAFRDDRPVPAGMAARLKSAGASIVTLTGQAELMDVAPLEAELPVDTIRSVVGMLRDAVPDVRCEVRPPVRQRAVFSTRWGQTTESFVAVGRRRLFGISTSPSDESRCVAVFLNVANESHIGPARMWPDLARRWSSEGGIAGLRFDFSGVGDSPDLVGKPRDVTYTPEWIDDLDDVVKWIATRGKRSIAVGLCSGAYAALEAALRSRVDGVVLANPILDTIGMTMLNREPITADPRRAALRQWPEWLAGSVVRHRRLATGAWRGLQQIDPSRAAMGVVGDVMRRGTSVFLALGPEDRPPFDANWYWRMREPRMRREGSFERWDIDALDHSVFVAEGRDTLALAMTRHVLRNFSSSDRRGVTA